MLRAKLHANLVFALPCILAFAAPAAFAEQVSAPQPVFAPAAPVPAPKATASEPLWTVAESSNWQATSTSAQVGDLLDAIAGNSKCAHRTSMGQTTQGKQMPVIVLSNPKVTSPQEARELASKEGRAIVLLFGNIHAGEVDAKEAYLMLARELALQGTAHDADDRKKLVPDAASLLEQLIIIIAPNYNPDGNDMMKPIDIARPGQAGPAQGAGQRHNAMDRDLNRDWGKLETPEARNIVNFMNQWDPHVIVDGHTTNGSWHRYLMTYAGPKVPAGDERLITWTRDEFFPKLDRAMLAQHGQHTFFYGDFESDESPGSTRGEPDANKTDPAVADGTKRLHTKWTTFPAVARYSTGYLGLRNRIGILSESYSYSSYKDRITGSRAFALELLREIAKDRARVRELISQADEDGAGRGATAGREIVIRHKPSHAPKRANLLGFVEERKAGRWTNTGEEREYDVAIWNRCEPTLTVSRPAAYALLGELPRVIENLQLHGIKIETLAAPLKTTAEQYTIESATPASREFQGHVLISAEATKQATTMTLPAGTRIVRTNQPLGTLAVYLLEPQCEDGLVTWNFFDAWMKPGEKFPVVRVIAGDQDSK